MPMAEEYDVTAEPTQVVEAPVEEVLEWEAVPAEEIAPE